MWQEVVFGFCGLRNAMCAPEMTFDPCLPEQIKRIAFRIQWKGAPVRVTLTQETLALENLSDRALAFHVRGQHHQVTPHSTVTAKLT
jgi:trehalose/maltose hydrolase-like predicted phosphorylase